MSEIRAFYAHGLNSLQLAKQYKVNHQTILHVIPKDERRAATRRRKELPMDKIVPLLKDNVSVADLAAQYRVSQNTMRARLRDVGALPPVRSTKTE
ncbi:hypothetical protein [Streptomyces sp. NPDC051572]|uniref:hypothetical protein n=1 Tax=Streptomyces sp. NPDC051572 TaxID=3155802 RepID=UPI00344B2FCC